MARIAITFGLLLFALSVVGLFLTMDKRPVMFTPMIFGIFLLFFGVVGLNPHRRRNAIRCSVAVASCGAFLAGLRWLVMVLRSHRGHEVNPLAGQLVGIMTLICAVFLVICAYDVIASRRRGSTD